MKLKFLLGLARKVAETNDIINYPQVRETLGLLAAKVNNIEALIVAMEATGEHYEGYFVPDRHILCTAQVHRPDNLSRKSPMPCATLSGGGLIMVPSSAADFDDPETRGASSARPSPRRSRSPKERVKLMKLTWDAIGSEFGSRHLQYEMFYSGATFVTAAIPSASSIGLK